MTLPDPSVEERTMRLRCSSVNGAPSTKAIAEAISAAYEDGRRDTSAGLASYFDGLVGDNEGQAAECERLGDAKGAACYRAEAWYWRTAAEDIRELVPEAGP